MLKLLFVQSDVKRPLLSVGKLTQSGAEVKFGSEGSWIVTLEYASIIPETNGGAG